MHSRLTLADRTLANWTPAHPTQVSRTSVCASWGAVAGTLRYFADRFGRPRASIEGTELPEAVIRRYARRSPPGVAFETHRRREGLVVVHTVTYFGFELDRDIEALPSPFPDDLAESARGALAEALVAGATPHPDQSAVRRALERLGYYWRRSGGTLAEAATDRSMATLRAQLAPVRSWHDFVETRLVLDVDGRIPADIRGQLESLPASVHLFGDRLAIDYEVERGTGVARLRLREGHARRLRDGDLPALDRPVRFTVIRGKREALRADSLAELRAKLKALPAHERTRAPARRRRR